MNFLGFSSLTNGDWCSQSRTLNIRRTDQWATAHMEENTGAHNSLWEIYQKGAELML